MSEVKGHCQRILHKTYLKILISVNGKCFDWLFMQMEYNTGHLFVHCNDIGHSGLVHNLKVDTSVAQLGTSEFRIPDYSIRA